VIRQGDVFWVELVEPRGSEPGYRHPYVVVQNNIFNASKLQTVVVCALTSNLARASAPGNVLLCKEEANLPKRSVVNITQVMTMDKNDLRHKIGSVSKQRMREIIDGIGLLLEPRDN
jgi:mRNA interferase MazF